MPGLTAAAERLREWHAGLAPEGVSVIALVLTAARPGQVPVSVRRYRGVVAELVEDLYSIGWHDELITRDLADLAQYLPFDPAPPRRAGLRDAVPADVHRAGSALLTRLAASRQDHARELDSERQGQP